MVKIDKKICQNLFKKVLNSYINGCKVKMNEKNRGGNNTIPLQVFMEVEKNEQD